MKNARAGLAGLSPGKGLSMQANRIRRVLRRQPNTDLGVSAYIEGRLSARRGDDLAALILRGWQRWPGDDSHRAELLANAVIGYLASHWREGAA
jgi:hypothetical protein